MTILETLAARFGFFKATGPAPSQLLAIADSQRWEMPDGSSAERQATLYANLTWIATAIDRTAEIGSAGIFSVKQNAGGPDSDDEDIPNHDFELLLRRPNPAQSRGEFLRDALSWFKLTGNLYIFLNAASEGAPPDELWIIPSQMMAPIPDGRSYVKGYKFTPPGKPSEFIPRWQILHLKTFNPLTPFVGLSAVQSLAMDSYGDIAQQRWNLSLFDKNNGKMPGILAFKHMIGDPEWLKIKRQRDEEWGGAKQAGAMLLRGVGDTVQWLPAALSQKEMDFLSGREFTKEEIYGKLAPGLASILAVNATEANAIAGKATLIEFGVWPMLEQLAQKFSSDILPLYGENLDGEFDDMRQTNRILDLQEQAEYAKYHTVNEVRAEYYDEDPLYLDESQETALADEQAVVAENRDMAIEQLNKPPAGKVPVPAKAQTDEAKKPNGGTLDPRGLMFVAQIGPATPLPGDPTKPPPAPPMPAQPPMMQAEGDAVPDKEAADNELAKWEKFALRHIGKDSREFEPHVLGIMEATRIKAGLKNVKTAAGVRAVFQAERDEPSDLARLAAAIDRATAKL